MSLKTAVLIPAAGSGKRFGGKKPKQFTDLDGRAVFIRTIEAFSDRDDVSKIVIAIPEDEQEMYEIKWGAKLAFYNVHTIIGGEERYETVQKLLDTVRDQEYDLIAIHDAARPCVSQKLISDVFSAAVEFGAAIPACKLVGTIKKSDADQNIAETIDRSELWEAQTPQTFKPDIIFKAYENLDDADKRITDDAQLVEHCGQKVKLVESDPSNIKITHGIDMAFASVICKNMAAEADSKRKKESLHPFAEDNIW